MATTSADLIATYNAGRDPSRLALKYKAMRGNPFSFLRGTAHLFHRRLVTLGTAPGGPPTWICGDLHLENYGTYLAGNGLTYFDINDYDECALTPCSWDVLRLVTSILVAAPVYGIAASDARVLAGQALDAYRTELASGKARWLERRTATGMIGDLFDAVKHRDADKFVRKRTVDKDGDKLDVGAPKMQAIADAAEYGAVRGFVETFARDPDGRADYRFKDAAFRIAGTGSLGIRRYVVLAERGDNGTLVLLDLKQALPSSVPTTSTSPQPAFASEAQRIVTVQTHAQAMPPTLLQATALRSMPFVLKELQPTSDRLNLEAMAQEPKEFAATLTSMAALSAWAQLRGSGHMTSATADDLTSFAENPKSLKDALAAAQALEEGTLVDWQDYRRAYDAGRFDAVLRAAAPGKGDDAD